MGRFLRRWRVWVVAATAVGAACLGVLEVVRAQSPIPPLVSGTVTDGTTALADVNVVVMDGTGAHLRGDTTDTQGAYQVDQLPAAQLTCRFTRPGYVTATQSLDLTQNQTVTINVSLSKCASISGSVSPATQGVRVVATDGTTATYAETDSSGAFSILGLGAGSYTVVAHGWHRGYMTVTAGPYTATANQQLSIGVIDISVSSAGTVAGTVTFDYTFGTGTPTNNPDEPAEGVTVFAERDGIAYGEATTSSTGAYSIPRLPAGTYTVGNAGHFTALPDGAVIDAGVEIVGVVATGVNVVASQTTTSDLEFLRGGSVSVEVKDESDQLLSGATVTLSLSGAVVVPAKLFNETTDTEGGSLLYDCASSIKPGTYTLTVSKTSYTTYTGSLIIYAGRRRLARVTLVAD